MKKINILYFFFYFFCYILHLIYNILKSNYLIDKIILNKNVNYKILKYKFYIKNYYLLILLCSSITMTPGTFVFDVSHEESIIYVHVLMDSNMNLNKVANDIYINFEYYLLEINKLC